MNYPRAQLLELLGARVAYLARDGFPVAAQRLYPFLAARVAVKDIHGVLDQAVSLRYIHEIWPEVAMPPDGRMQSARMFLPGDHVETEIVTVRRAA
jgi:hypothetical protein